jgi:hypothetical protein
MIGHLHLHLVEPIDALQRLVALGAADGCAVFLLEDCIEAANIVEGMLLESRDLVGKLERVAHDLARDLVLQQILRLDHLDRFQAALGVGHVGLAVQLEAAVRHARRGGFGGHARSP